MSRFSSFNNKPDSYQTWKASFTSIVKESNISAFEEMDLLIKWLGSESKRFASSIRGSNINDPVKELHRIWERLEDRKCRPEMIESACKKYKLKMHFNRGRISKGERAIRNITVIL